MELFERKIKGGKMDTEIVVYLLEERLEEIKKNLAGFWQEFLKELKSLSEDLIPDKKDLEKWTENMIRLLKKYEYTCGLLEGFNTRIRFIIRGIPSALETYQPEEIPDISSGKISASKKYEEEIINRIKNIVKKAEELK